MSKKPQQGPYKHYERPSTSRSQMRAREERKDKKGHPQIWAGIIIIAIILIAAIPILGAKLNNNQSHNIAEKSVQITKKHSSSSEHKKSIKKKKSKKAAIQSSSVDTAKSSSTSQEVNTQESSSSSTDEIQSSISSSKSSDDLASFKADSNGNYTIQTGDTLSEIAKANNTTVDNLMKINGISKQNSVIIGQTIKVKADDTSSSSNSSEN